MRQYKLDIVCDKHVFIISWFVFYVDTFSSHLSPAYEWENARLPYNCSDWIISCTHTVRCWKTEMGQIFINVLQKSSNIIDHIRAATLVAYPILYLSLSLCLYLYNNMSCRENVLFRIAIENVSESDILPATNWCLYIFSSIYTYYAIYMCKFSDDFVRNVYVYCCLLCVHNSRQTIILCSIHQHYKHFLWQNTNGIMFTSLITTKRDFLSHKTVNCRGNAGKDVNLVFFILSIYACRKCMRTTK